MINNIMFLKSKKKKTHTQTQPQCDNNESTHTV